MWPITPRENKLWKKKSCINQWKNLNPFKQNKKRKRFFQPKNCFASKMKMINSTILFRTKKKVNVNISMYTFFNVIFPWCKGLFCVFFTPSFSCLATHFNLFDSKKNSLLYPISFKKRKSNQIKFTFNMDEKNIREPTNFLFFQNQNSAFNLLKIC